MLSLLLAPTYGSGMSAAGAMHNIRTDSDDVYAQCFRSGDSRIHDELL
jgi:hypothetical protein